MSHDTLIRGSGGGGGGKGGGGSSHTPVEAADSLHSRQYARVVDLVSEGEISGLVDGLKSVALDDVVIQNDDNTFNFSGVTLVSRNGTQNQSYIPGFPAVENEVAVGVEIKAAQSVTRSFSNANLNAVRVTIGIPQLSYQNPSNGDLGGTSVEIIIAIQLNGGGFTDVKTDVICGKTTSRYRRSYRIELPGDGPWDIRISRSTADSTQSNLQNKTWWDSVTEIVDGKFRYPNSAINALQIDSVQFSSIPTRAYHLKGLIIRVPTNYDPVARTYTGSWNGTFKLAWSNNPAWVYYDLLTESRYGLGDFVDSAFVDKWALYDIAKYCDGSVPNGFGGYEPRFTCNMYLQTREEAYKVIVSLASVFRGMTYWGAGSISAVADKPADPIALFTPANVIGGQFTYQGSDRRQRHTVALVTWNDPDDFSRQKIEYVHDDAGIARYGVQETEVIAVGCASRGQAHRLGKWLLYTEQNETELITFRCGLDGLRVYPGAVFKTTDPTRAGVRMGGRLVSVSGATATLDAAVELVSGHTYTLSVVLPSGVVESKSVTSPSGTTATIALASEFSATPVPYAVWMLTADNLVPDTWRCLAIDESDQTTAEITAIAHDPNKFAEVELGLKFDQAPVSSIDTSAPTPPANLSLTSNSYRDTSGQIGIEINAGWESSAYRLEFNWRETNGNWQTSDTFDNHGVIRPAKLGVTYEVSVIALTALGRRSRAATATITVGNDALPVPASLLSLTATGGLFEVELAFTLATPLWPNDVVELYESSTNSLGGALLVAALKEPLRTFNRTGLAPGLTRYYWGRVVDAAGTPGPWYPPSATGGIAAAPSADPSALLTQLQKSVGMPQLAAELAAPIVSMPGAIHSQAVAAIQSALDDYDLTSRMQWQEAVTNATVTVDPVSGAIQLLATAAVTTDVEARLTAVEVVANADHGTLTSTVATLSSVAGDLTTAQSQITQLQNEVQLSASEVYVDNAIDGVAGVLTTSAANSLSALAAAEIQSALDLFDQSAQSRQNATSVALANETLQAHADAISAEATARSALVAVLANTIAAAVTETLTRASVDASLASSISTLLARLDTGDYASVKTQASATANALGDVEAKWGVQVQTMADGKRALAGIQLLAGTDGESTFAILADKLLIYKPDGTGVPKQIVTLGQINGQTALGLDGNLIVDGSIVARSLAAKTITAASGVIDDAAIQTAHIGTAVVSDLHIINGAVTLSAFASDNGYNRLWTAGSFSAATYDDEFSSVSFATKVGDDITVEAYCYFSTVNSSAALDSIYITPHLQVDGVDVCVGKRALWRVYDGSNHVAILLKAKISGTGSTRTAKLKVLYDHANFYNDALGKYRISQCVLSAFIRRR